MGCSLCAYIFCIVHVTGKKNWKLYAKKMGSAGTVAFIVMTVLYLLSIKGVVASRWDEFSFWAVSVKQMFYLDRFHCVAQAQSYFPEYPPGMQILEYIYQVLCGSFSEWRLYAAYMVYIFALLVPFLNGCRSVFLGILGSVLLGISGTIFFPGLFCNLMVDFALGATFAYGIGVLLSCKKEELCSLFTAVNVAAVASMLVLIKQAGKLFALVLVASYLVPVLRLNWGRMRQIWARAVLLPVSSPLVFSLTWSWKYKSDGLTAAFDTGSYDIREFFAILFGNVKEGYRVAVKDRFFEAVATQKNSFGIFSVTNLIFAVLTGIFLVWVFCLAKKYHAGAAVVEILVIPYTGMFLYWLGLLASYMYTFSEGEGSSLASLQRYLNIYYACLLLGGVFCLVHILVSVQEIGKTGAAWLMAALILCTEFGEYRMLFSRGYAAASMTHRGPLQGLADQLDTKGKVEEFYERGRVLLIHREGYPHVPVNEFTYLLYPYYSVPWECSYGSTVLWEGDSYTRIFTQEEFRSHVDSLGVNYIAIDYVDEDFKSCYGALFDNNLENGQIYQVTSSQVPYMLGGGVR